MAVVNAVAGFSLADVAQTIFLLLQLQYFLKRDPIPLEQVVATFSLVHAAEALLGRRLQLTWYLGWQGVFGATDFRWQLL